jgi:hypothetical protein
MVSSVERLSDIQCPYMAVEGRRLKTRVSIGQLPTKLLAFLGLANPLHFNAARSAVGSIAASSL